MPNGDFQSRNKSLDRSPTAVQGAASKERGRSHRVDDSRAAMPAAMLFRREHY